MIKLTLEQWAKAVDEVSQRLEVDLLLYGNAFVVVGDYPVPPKRLDPTKMIFIPKDVGGPKWSHPDLEDGEKVEHHRLKSLHQGEFYGEPPVAAASEAVVKDKISSDWKKAEWNQSRRRL